MHITHSELLHYLLKWWQYPVVQHVPKSKAFVKEPQSLTALEREHAELLSFFFSPFASCCISYLAIGPYVASLLHWLWKWSQQKKKQGLQKLSLEKMNDLTWAQMKNTQRSGCLTWGRAWITVSSRARIPTAIFKSFNTSKKQKSLMRTDFCTFRIKRVSVCIFIK